MSLIVRTLFPPAIYEAGRREAVEIMIAVLTEVLLSLKADETPLDPVTREAAIEDLTRQIVDLEAYQADGNPSARRPEPRHLE
jgi:hypothetical protein